MGWGVCACTSLTITLTLTLAITLTLTGRVHMHWTAYVHASYTPIAKLTCILNPTLTPPPPPSPPPQALRKKFPGTPENVVTFFGFVAEEVRQVLAQLGYTSLDQVPVLIVL